MSLIVRLLNERIEELKEHILWCAVRNHHMHHIGRGPDWKNCTMDSCLRAAEILEKDEG